MKTYLLTALTLLAAMGATAQAQSFPGRAVYSSRLQAEFILEDAKLSSFTEVPQARLVSTPRRGSPLDGFQAGDAIRMLDCVPAGSLEELENHNGSTEVHYVESGSKRLQSRRIMIGTRTFGREFTVVAVENVASTSLTVYIRWNGGPAKRLTIPPRSSVVDSEPGFGNIAELAFDQDALGLSRDFQRVPLNGTDVSLSRPPQASDVADPAGLLVFRNRVYLAK